MLAFLVDVDDTSALPENESHFMNTSSM